MTFDPVASVYRLCETIAFGNGLQRARIRWLNEIGSPSRVLIFGEGDGRFLAELRRLHPNAKVDCIDSSKRMLGLAEARAGSGGVAFVNSDINDWLPHETYDLIVTHFFLDCFEGEALKAIVSKLAKAAAPDAIWLLADFTIPERVVARFWARLLVRTMYAFFRLTCGLQTQRLVDPTPLLEANGFRRNQRLIFLAGMVKSELWSKVDATFEARF